MSPLSSVTGALLLLCLVIRSGHRTFAQDQDNELNATESSQSPGQEAKNENRASGTKKSNQECLALPAAITEEVDTLEQIIFIAMNPDKKTRVELEKKLGVMEEHEEATGPQQQGEGAEVITEDEIKTLPKSGKMHALIR